MSFTAMHSWKKAPFVRILLPMIAGIVMQWYVPLTLSIWMIIAVGAFVFLAASFYLPLFDSYRYGWLNGCLIHFLFLGLGGLLAWKNDIRNDPQWLDHHYRAGAIVIATLQEPPVEKINSYKILARATSLVIDGKSEKVNGNIILYLQKNNTASQLRYGQQIAFRNSLQPIKNAGNPGGFDYVRYSLFQDISSQVYLKENDFILLPKKNEKYFTKFLFSVREKVISILRRYIKGKKETGLAEALLIGYKDDLDKTLVQSYSNTGVVHVIAISGLHLGLIYWLLLLLTKPLSKRKKWRWLAPVIIIVCLWLFSLIAGGQPSVLRSAVMFTCIAMGDMLSKKSYIINTLALSAFLLLCYNPYWLWDVGFQLSYAAVLSIVLFMRPIYNWLYAENKLLDFLWKLNAVTLAAQILTLPISIYHFHQFPNYFLLTNFIAVPLSSIIVLAEILLITISVIPFIAGFVGWLTTTLIYWLNSYIEHIEGAAFSIWDNLSISILQMLLLFVVIAGAGTWLMNRQKTGVHLFLAALVAFFALRSYSLIASSRQQNIIVYNVPKHRAVDVINGNNCVFIGDSLLLKDDFTRNFHLKPSRTGYRIRQVLYEDLSFKTPFIEYNHKKILLLNTASSLSRLSLHIPIDLMIISGNPGIYFSSLANSLQLQQVVFDGSVPPGKLKRWKNECAALHIPFHDVSEKGAFVMKLN